MIGAATLLAVDAPLPGGVRLRRVTEREDVRAASAMADAVFGEPASEARAADLLDRIADGGELWVAESGDQIVSCGRLEPVEGTAFRGSGAAPPDPSAVAAASTAH